METDKILEEDLQIYSDRIELDFHQNSYKVVLAKEYDHGSRYIPITLTNNGNFVKVPQNKYTIQMKCHTPDDRTVYTNDVTVQEDGTLLLEISKQMVTYPGKALVEIMFFDKNFLERLAVMNFYLVIEPSPVSDEEIMASDEFKALEDFLREARKNYEHVITEAKKHADAAKQSEDNAKKSEDNAKQSETAAQNSAQEAEESEEAAASSAEEAQQAQQQAEESAEAAKTDKEAADKSKDAAAESEKKAKEHETATKDARDEAVSSAEDAEEYSTEASNSADAAEKSASSAASDKSATEAAQKSAKESETKAQKSADDAEQSSLSAEESADTSEYYAWESYDWAKLSESYAHGGTSIRKDEETDNAKRYYEFCKETANSLVNNLTPRGSCTFEELEKKEDKVAGNLYNITDDFTTDDTFIEGAGHKYFAGTDVFWSVDGVEKNSQGKWDVFQGNNDLLMQLAEDVSNLEKMLLERQAFFGILVESNGENEEETTEKVLTTDKGDIICMDFAF